MSSARHGRGRWPSSLVCRGQTFEGIAIVALSVVDLADEQVALRISGDAVHVADPAPGDVDGFQTYLGRYRAALPVQDAAAAATSHATRPSATTDHGEPTAEAEPRLQEEEVTR